MRYLLFFFPIFLYSCLSSGIKNTAVQPNIVIIFTDDQGYNDVGCFGSPDIATPHLDKMAKEGTILTHYYSAQAVCSASRAGLLTGCYPNRIGIHNALGPGNTHGINSEETTLAEMLKKQGYKTGIFGKWHLGHHPEFLPTRHGFDTFYGIPYSNDMWPYHPQQYNFPPLPLFEDEKIIDTLEDQTNLTVEITKRSVDFIKQNKDNPFFLYVPHPQPHVPLFVSDNFKGASPRGLYGDVIMEIDWSVGQINQTLKELGLEENTIVIFTSDNGPWLSYGDHAGSAFPLREGKGTAWEGGQREPFIIKYPRLIPENQTVSTPIMAIDLLPTLASLVGAPLPELKIDGKDVIQIILGKQKEMAHPAYFYYYRTNELFAVRSGPWKMYFPHRYRTMEGQELGSGGLPGNYRQITLEKLELYHLTNDPSEVTDVAASHPEVVKSLESLGDSIRVVLGDRIQKINGLENREPGRIGE